MTFAKPLKLAAFILVPAAACAPAWAADDTYLFGATNNHEVVSLITDQGTFLTSTDPFNAGQNNSGYWSGTFPNSTKVSVDNYIVGSPGVSGEINDFFTFFIPEGLGAITSASLSAPRGGDGGIQSTAGVPLTYSLFDVSTAAATLNANTGTSAAIFNDLGSGVLYGSITVNDIAVPDPLVITLDAGAIAAINSSGGEFFSIGGTLTPSSASPEPNSMLLVAPALLALVAPLRRRKIAVSRDSGGLNQLVEDRLQ